VQYLRLYAVVKDAQVDAEGQVWLCLARVQRAVAELNVKALRDIRGKPIILTVDV
jgi:hypothetical protein